MVVVVVGDTASVGERTALRFGGTGVGLTEAVVLATVDVVGTIVVVGELLAGTEFRRP